MCRQWRWIRANVLMRQEYGRYCCSSGKYLWNWFLVYNLLIVVWIDGIGEYALGSCARIGKTPFFSGIAAHAEYWAVFMANLDAAICLQELSGFCWLSRTSMSRPEFRIRCFQRLKKSCERHFDFNWIMLGALNTVVLWILNELHASLYEEVCVGIWHSSCLNGKAFFGLGSFVQNTPLGFYNLESNPAPLFSNEIHIFHAS